MAVRDLCYNGAVMPRRSYAVSIVGLIGALNVNAAAQEANAPSTTPEVSMPFQLTSPAFQHGTSIPVTLTCDGSNVSPALTWGAPPNGTQSVALIADDPDAPSGRWIHWVIYNIPVSTKSLQQGVPPRAELPDGARQGRNDFGRPGYGGPCPPSGTHRYRFTLYAVDTTLRLKPEAITAQTLERALTGHTLAQTQLMGTYQRARR